MKQSTNFLGFCVNNKLTWDNHINHLHQKLTSNLKLFCFTRHLISDKIARTFYLNPIHSYLTYGLHIDYPITPQTLTNDLFKLQKRALRLIHRVRLKDKVPTHEIVVEESSQAWYYTQARDYPMRKV